VTIAAGSDIKLVAALGAETLGVDADVVCAGVGEVVATVAGALQAAIANEEKTSSDDNDFMSDPG